MGRADRCQDGKGGAGGCGRGQGCATSSMQTGGLGVGGAKVLVERGEVVEGGEGGGGLEKRMGKERGWDGVCGR